MSFREDFIWGTATSAYQVEGAASADGRGPSIWDTFTRQPGRVFQGHHGDVACDHYHRYAQDVALMRELGLNSYRFSLSWTRLLPEGTGAVCEKGVDFYNRLIDTLLEAGIRPFATLFHWDYPTALQARGAWENPDSPRWFAEYADLCARRFGDRVKDFITFNEPQCFIGLGYEIGEHAPGLRLGDASLVPMAHNVLKAHGEAVRALRAGAPGCRVGYAPCGNACIPETPQDVDAARRAYFSTPQSGPWGFSVAWWSDPVVLGRYPQEGLNRLGAYLPRGWEADMAGIAEPLDFYAQNIYNGDIIRRADNAQGFERVTPPVGVTKTAIQWTVMPEALYWGPKLLYERYKLPFIITENGISCHDAVSLDGKVHDPNRQDYLHRYLLAYRRAADEGVDARGYFVWSLLDNFEWTNGYNERFGLVYVDYATQQRILKDSARWYQRVIATNGASLDDFNG